MDNETLRFRLATPDDAAQIQNLVQSAFRAEEDTRPNWIGSPELAARFRIGADEVLAAITRPDGAVLVATDAATGSLVASVQAAMQQQQQQQQQGPLARLSMLAVDGAHQRRGLGRLVLARAEEHCRREWGARRLGLGALSTRGALIDWYVRRGFRRTGATSAFPPRAGGREPAPGLCFVELEKELAGPRGGIDG